MLRLVGLETVGRTRERKKRGCKIFQRRRCWKCRKSEGIWEETMMRRKNGTNENSKEVRYGEKERGEGRIKEARGQRRMVFQRDGDGREWYFKIGREKRLLRKERRKIEGGKGKEYRAWRRRK